MRAQLTTINHIKKHPNADTLDIAQVLGWQVVIKSDTFQDGDSVVFIEPDSVLPEELATKLGIVNYLKNRINKHNERVLVTTRIKLRGEPSFGVIISEDKLSEDELNSIVKFEPVIKYKSVSIDTIENHPKINMYCDIENLRNVTDMFTKDDIVMATVKFHGTNSLVGYAREETGEYKWNAGSRRYMRKMPDKFDFVTTNNTYWYPVTIENLREMIKYVAMKYMAESVVVYGEIFGSGIQDFDYGRNGIDYVAFDIAVNGRFLTQKEFNYYCSLFDVYSAPIVFYNYYDFDKLKQIAEGENTEGGNHVREGIVIRGVNESYHPKYGRRIAKLISDNYLFRKNAEEMDTTDA